MRAYVPHKVAIPAAIVVVLALTFLLSCSQTEHPTVVIRTASNGATIIAQENRGLDVVSVQVWFRDGALYEATDEIGEAALLHCA
ncbi:hypothetical protein K8S17_01325, partial [bacterium]|nr:hypothetical protein [bacterium]